jgi:hypothetical protein
MAPFTVLALHWNTAHRRLCRGWLAHTHDTFTRKEPVHRKHLALGLCSHPNTTTPPSGAPHLQARYPTCNLRACCRRCWLHCCCCADAYMGWWNQCHMPLHPHLPTASCSPQTFFLFLLRDKSHRLSPPRRRLARLAHTHAPPRHIQPGISQRCFSQPAGEFQRVRATMLMLPCSSIAGSGRSLAPDDVSLFSRAGCPPLVVSNFAVDM